MKLSREQELYLIDLGMKALLAERFDKINQAKHARRHKRTVIKKEKPVKNTGKAWSEEQRKKFSKTMAKKWAERKAQKESA